jgi:hypothetical protein
MIIKGQISSKPKRKLEIPKKPDFMAFQIFAP